MADNNFDSFLISIGFKDDPTGARRAQETAAKLEAGITATATAEAAKRDAVDKTSTNRRATTAQQLARLLTAMEQDRADRVEGMRKAEQADADKRDTEALKRATERRDALVKSTRGIIVTMAALPLAIGAGITAAATGLLWATDRAAKGFERLYYVAANSGTSAAGLTKFEYAASRLGTTAEDARGSVARFGENLKTLPAMEGMLKNMGIATRDANGHLRDAADLAAEYIDHLKALPQLQREARASAWGISESTTRAVNHPEFAGYEAEQDRINKIIGADPNKAAAGGAAFESAMKRVEAILGALGTRVETNLFEVIRPRIDAVAQWVLDHGDTITNFVNTTAKGLTDLGTAFANSQTVKDALNGLSGGLERAAKYVASEDFRKDIQTFVDDVKSLAHAIRSALEFIGVLPDRSGAPSKALVNGGRPDVGPRDNDLGLPGVDSATPSDTATASARADAMAKGTEEAASGFWGWVKAKAKDIGWGDRLHDDNRVREAILSTAADTKKLAEAANAPGGGGSDSGSGGGGVMGAVKRTLGYAAVAAGGQAGRGGGPSALRSDQQKANAAAIADELRKAGAPDEGTASVLGSMQTESSFNPRAHNDVTGGHTGLWQWDARRWPKIRAWIEKQGGDPWDARWQTKAYIAEGRAKPGDAIYDNGETSAGFDDVMNSKGNLPKAVHGVQRSERFGRGEEGGRAAHAAKWLGNLPGATTDSPTASTTSGPSEADYIAALRRMNDGWKSRPASQARLDQNKADEAIRDAFVKAHPDAWKLADKALGPTGMGLNHVEPGPEVRGRARTLSADDGGPVKVEVTKADKLEAFARDAVKHAEATKIVAHALGAKAFGGNPLMPHIHHPFRVPPSGITPHLQTAYDFRRVKGDTNITHNPTFNINGGDPKQSMDAARMVADRGTKDLVRNMRAVEQ